MVKPTIPNYHLISDKYQTLQTNQIRITPYMRILIKKLTDTDTLPCTVQTKNMLQPNYYETSVLESKYHNTQQAWDKSQLTPITVSKSEFYTPEQPLYVIQDGRHRFIRYIINGYTTIPVHVM